MMIATPLLPSVNEDNYLAVVTRALRICPSRLEKYRKMRQKNSKRPKQKRRNLRLNAQKLQKRTGNDDDDVQVVEPKLHVDTVGTKTRTEACQPAADVHNDLADKENTELLDEINVNRFYMQAYNLTNELMNDVSGVQGVRDNKYNTSSFSNTTATKANINSLRDALQSMLNASDEIRSFYKAISAREIKVFEEKIIEYEKKIERMTYENLKMKSELVADQQSSNRKIVDLEKALQELSIQHRKEVAQKIVLLQQTWRGDMSQKFEANSSREEVFRLENNLYNLRKDIAVLQAQLVILQHGSNSFENTIHLLSREKGYVERCMKNGVERNTHLASSLSKMAKQMKEQEIQLKNANVKCDKLETKYEKKAMQCDALQRKMEGILLEMEKRDNFISVQNNLINDLKDHIVHLKSRRQELRVNRRQSESWNVDEEEDYGKK